MKSQKIVLFFFLDKLTLSLHAVTVAKKHTDGGGISCSIKTIDAGYNVFLLVVRLLFLVSQ